jgi:hypothetical protein
MEVVPTAFTAEERWLDDNAFGLFDGSDDGSSDGKTLGLEESEG